MRWFRPKPAPAPLDLVNRVVDGLDNEPAQTSA